MTIYWTITVQSTLFWPWTIHLKSLTDGYPSLVYKAFVCFEPLIYLFVDPLLFLETLLIITISLSVGL